MPAASRSRAARWRSVRKRWARTTPMWRRMWRRWRRCWMDRASTPRASRCTARCWPSSSGHYGPEHYEVAVNLNNLAANYHQQGRLADAEPPYRRALALKEKLLGANHPDVALTLNNLAVLCKQEGRYTEAAALYQRSLAVYEQALDEMHPKVVECRANYEALLEATS